MAPRIGLFVSIAAIAVTSGLVGGAVAQAVQETPDYSTAGCEAAAAKPTAGSPDTLRADVPADLLSDFDRKMPDHAVSITHTGDAAYRVDVSNDDAATDERLRDRAARIAGRSLTQLGVTSPELTVCTYAG